MYKKLYKNNLFADAHFILKNKKIDAHKCVLATESEYFKIFFTKDSQRSTSGNSFW